MRTFIHFCSIFWTFDLFSPLCVFLFCASSQETFHCNNTYFTFYTSRTFSRVYSHFYWNKMLNGVFSHKDHCTFTSVKDLNASPSTDLCEHISIYQTDNFTLTSTKLNSSSVCLISQFQQEIKDFYWICVFVLNILF